MEFLNNDQNLRCLNYLVIADTRLDEKTSSDYLAEHLSNWRILKRDDAKDGCQSVMVVLLWSLCATWQCLVFLHTKESLVII